MPARNDVLRSLLENPEDTSLLDEWIKQTEREAELVERTLTFISGVTAAINLIIKAEFYLADSEGSWYEFTLEMERRVEETSSIVAKINILLSLVANLTIGRIRRDAAIATRNLDLLDTADESYVETVELANQMGQEELFDTITAEWEQMFQDFHRL